VYWSSPRRPAQGTSASAGRGELYVFPRRIFGAEPRLHCPENFRTPLRVDAVLSSQQPIQGLVQLRRLDVPQLQFVGQTVRGGFGLQTGEVGQFGTGRNDPQHQHGEHQLGFATGLGREEAVESNFAQCAQDGRHMSMRKAADDLELVVLRGQGFTGESLANDGDQIGGQIGEVSEREMLDLSLFAKGVSQEMGDIGFPVELLLDGGDMNGAFVGAHGPMFNGAAPRAQALCVGGVQSGYALSAEKPALRGHAPAKQALRNPPFWLQMENRLLCDSSSSSGSEADFGFKQPEKLGLNEFSAEDRPVLEAVTSLR
jgi:hypothetical protein